MAYQASLGRVVAFATAVASISAAGCGSNNGTSCDQLPKPPPLASCVQPVGGWPDANSVSAWTPTPRSLSISATVAAVSYGPVGGGCLVPPTDTSVNIVALTVATAAGDRYDVEYQVPSPTVLWSVGDAIDVAYLYKFGGWSPTVQTLTLAHGQTVDVYVGLGGTVADLASAPFTFAVGQERCSQHESCGSWTANDLKIGPEETVVPYGSSVSKNGYRIVHGGMQQQTSAAGSCFDWYVASIAAAVVREGAPAVPASPTITLTSAELQGTDLSIRWQSSTPIQNIWYPACGTAPRLLTRVVASAGFSWQGLQDDRPKEGTMQPYYLDGVYVENRSLGCDGGNSCYPASGVTVSTLAYVQVGSKPPLGPYTPVGATGTTEAPVPDIVSRASTGPYRLQLKYMLGACPSPLLGTSLLEIP